MIVSMPIQTANISMADSLILMVLALVVFGPRRLPQIGRQIGKLMYEFRKASNDFKFQMEEELRQAEDADRRKQEEERQRQRALEAPPQESVSADPQIVNAVEAPAEGSPAVEATAASEEVSASTSSSEEKEVANEVTPEPAESGPKIAPPSTGETVSAGTPPWKRMQYAEAVEQGEANTVASEVGTDGAATEVDPAQGDSGKATEAISRNG